MNRMDPTRMIFKDLRVMSVFCHDDGDVEVDLRGSGAWAESDGYVDNLNVTVHVSADLEETFEVWRDQDTPLVGWDLSEPAPLFLLADPANRNVAAWFRKPEDAQ